MHNVCLIFCFVFSYEYFETFSFISSFKAKTNMFLFNYLISNLTFILMKKKLFYLLEYKTELNPSGMSFSLTKNLISKT